MGIVRKRKDEVENKRDVSIRSAWIKAYIIIVVLMSLCFFVGMQLVLNSVAKNAEQENQNNASMSKSILEKEWRDSFIYGMQVMCNQSFKIIGTDAFEEYEQRQSAYRLVSSMQNYIISNPVIEDFYMYYPDANYIIGTKGVFRLRSYWALLYHNNQVYSLEQWSNELFGDKTVGYFVVQNKSGIDVYYRMVDYFDGGRILVAKLNSSKISAELEWIRSNQSCDFLAIVDETDHVYACAGDRNTFVQTDNRLSSVSDRDYLQTNLDSSLRFLYYVTITAKNAAYKQTRYVSSIAFICLVFSFLGGLILAFYFTNKNVEPIKRIAMRYTKGDNIHKNELAQIEMQLEDLYMENLETLHDLTKQKNMAVTRSFLNECIRPTAGDPQPVELISAIYGVEFENSDFMVLMRERTEEDYNDKIIDLLNQWEDESVTVCWTERQNLDVFLLNFNGNQATETEFVNRLQQISNAGAHIICSKKTDNMEQIRSCYLDCLRQLKHKWATLEENTEDDFSSKFNEFRGKSVFSGFSKFLGGEDYAGAMQLLQELCDSYLSSGSELERSCRRYRVIQQFLFLHDSQLCEQYLAPIADEQSAEVWRDTLTNLLKRLIKRKRMAEISEGEIDLAGRIRTTVDEEYANPALDLRMIAESIGMSQSYVSRVFKKKYDIGITQYLNQVRIEHAKEMMRCGNQSIKAIAMQVGYTSDVQFIRVFKKIENVTPGMFKLAVKE